MAVMAAHLVAAANNSNIYKLTVGLLEPEARLKRCALRARLDGFRAAVFVGGALAPMKEANR
jgi:hypothetical protein